MGKIFQGIFGGSSSKQTAQNTSSSTSSNQAYPFLQQTYAPQTQSGINATNALQSLLGLSGDPHAYDGAYNDFKESSGYSNIFNEGQRAVTGNASAHGMLQSGATLKALQDRGQATAKSYFLDYLDRLLGMSDQGYKAGSLISSAGGTSQSQSQGTSSGKSSTSPGISAFLGQLMSAIPAG